MIDTDRIKIIHMRQENLFCIKIAKIDLSNPKIHLGKLDPSFLRDMKPYNSRSSPVFPNGYVQLNRQRVA